MACQRGLEACQWALGGTDVWMNGPTDRISPHSTGLCPLLEPLPKRGETDVWTDRLMDGQTDGQMDVQNFSPFYRTLSPVGAAAQKT